jgi:hypothetical protein
MGLGRVVKVTGPQKLYEDKFIKGNELKKVNCQNMFVYIVLMSGMLIVWRWIVFLNVYAVYMC